MPQMQLNKKDVLLQMNQILQQSGMLQVDLVDPADLVPQRNNARYFTPETGISIYDRFADSIRTLKKRENIKSNATALMRLVKLASIQLEKEAVNGVHK